MTSTKNSLKKLELLPFKVDTSKLHDILERYPHLWDMNTARTAHPDSPHHELSDIWVRYAGQDSVTDGVHISRWLDLAKVLPVKDLVDEVMSHLKAKELGGVLITRQPPGATCHPHVDGGKGSWHADHFEKVAVSITSAPGQFFCVEELSVEPAPGDVWYFDNWHEHWVTNQTEHDRMTLIICFRCDEALGQAQTLREQQRHGAVSVTPGHRTISCQ
jgi:hypothetical protein